LNVTAKIFSRKLKSGSEFFGTAFLTGDRAEKFLTALTFRQSKSGTPNQKLVVESDGATQ